MPKILVCDIDGVLADTVSTALTWFNYQFGTRHIPADIKEWNPSLRINAHETIAMADWMVASIKDPDFHRDVKPFPGVRMVLEDAILDGWTIQLATARAPETQVLTEQWLAWNSIPYDSLAHESEKHILPGNLLIEDNLENVLKWINNPPLLRPALLVDTTYNQSVWLPYDIQRVRDWVDIDVFLGGFTYGLHI